MRDQDSPLKLLAIITVLIALLIGSTTAVVAWRTHEQGKIITTPVPQ